MSETERQRKTSVSSDSLSNDDSQNKDENAVIDPEYLIKHPLQNSWTLWFFKNDARNKNWEDNQKPITTFHTVEDFWALYNHIELASKLMSGLDYSLFKEGIKPMWEDERNSRGGRWVIQLEKKFRQSCLDNYWLEVMLCLIGEAFDDHSKSVNGAVVSVRPKGDKIGIWCADQRNAEAIISIGKKIKERLKIDPKTTVGFEAHNDTKTKSGSTARNRFVV